MIIEPDEKNFGSYLAFFRHQTQDKSGKALSQDNFALAMYEIDNTILLPEIRSINGKRGKVLSALQTG